MPKITKVEFKVGEISLEPNVVLEQAKDNYQSVLIVGWDNEGYFDVRSTNNLDQKECVFLAQMLTSKILNGDYGT